MDKSDLEVYQNIVMTGGNVLSTESSMNQCLYSQVCQMCGVILKMDTNLYNMSENQYKQLSQPFLMNRDFELDNTLSTSNTKLDSDMEMSLTALVTPMGGMIDADKMNPPNELNNDDVDDDEDLTMKLFEPLYRKSVTQSRSNFIVCPINSNNQMATNNDGWSARINATSALFDMMSSNSNIDHPLCEECADQLLNELDVQCKIIEKEYCDYTALINRLNQQLSNENEINQLESELKQLEREEKELLEKLEKSKGIEENLEKEKEKLEGEEAGLLQQEQLYLMEYSNSKRQLIKLEENQESLDNQLRNTKFHLNRLRTVNVLNATFHIWHSGPFGTINYFRLGRLPGTPVEWEEINAGLGQVNLLLHCLARKVKLEFKRFKLVPYGSYSYIEVVENCQGFKVGEQLNMYRVKGYKYFFDWDNKFDQAMQAFLDCLKQFEDKIKSIDAQFSMPYKINSFKLEDKNGSAYSIKCNLNSHEQWTKALKYMLTNLKWSLAWVTLQTDL